MILFKLHPYIFILCLNIGIQNTLLTFQTKEIPNPKIKEIKLRKSILYKTYIFLFFVEN